MAISPVTSGSEVSLAGRERRGLVVSILLALGVALLFWVPSARVGRGYFPVPLDDVYIHFDFARSMARGHPFEWIVGQGYSSGETSPLYAVTLSLGWLIGFRGRALGLWAALVALLGVASLLRSVRELVRPCPAWLAWSVSLLPLSVGLVDWTLFSGMEVAVFVAALGRALVALVRSRAPRARPTREVLQWRLGLWGAVLVLLRPEAGILVATFAVSAARRAGARSGLAAVLRVGLPGAAATLALMAANFLGSGDARSAGAQLKLLSSNPYLSDVERARVFAENLVTFWLKAVRAAAHPALLVGLLVLWGIALTDRKHRGIVITCLVQAVGWILLVSWNANAPHHNFRYYVPALVLLCVAAALGLATVAAHHKWVAAFATFAAIAFALPALPAQVRHYRSACANIRDQQIEVGERLARLPSNAKILLGDAGAIPFVSERGSIDALGLGGYRTMPFARAALYGEGATVELIERLEDDARPTHFALYPNWFGALTARFGTEIDRVTIANNVICGSPTKAIYRADWSALAHRPGWSRPASIVDELDVGDVIDEGEHGYAPPLPHGGWSTLDVLADDSETKRFDAGRTIPDGAVESFVVKGTTDGPVTIIVRVDAGARGIVLRTPRATKDLELDPVRPGHWRRATASLERIDAGDVITLEARGEYRDYHVWIERHSTANLHDITLSNP